MSEPQTPAQIAYEAWVRSKENPPMPATPPPGQIAYEAYYTALAGGICHCLPLTWGATPLAQQRAWDAAAQAVRCAYKAEMADAWQAGVLLRQAQEETP
jgi:hypothetical protein